MAVATTRRLTAASWAQEDLDLTQQVLETDRTDRDEIAIHIRGFSDTADVGSIYLTDEAALALSKALAEAVSSR